jgi:hypothetical protein
VGNSRPARCFQMFVTMYTCRGRVSLPWPEGKARVDSNRRWLIQVGEMKESSDKKRVISTVTSISRSVTSAPGLTGFSQTRP